MRLGRKPESICGFWFTHLPHNDIFTLVVGDGDAFMGQVRDLHHGCIQITFNLAELVFESADPLVDLPHLSD